MATFKRPLNVGKIDNFTLTLSSTYLEGEAILSANVTTESANLTVDSVSNNGTVISAVCSGVLSGSAELDFSWSTASRSGCESHNVIVLDC